MVNGLGLLGVGLSKLNFNPLLVVLIFAFPPVLPSLLGGVFELVFVFVFSCLICDVPSRVFCFSPPVVRGVGNR